MPQAAHQRDPDPDAPASRPSSADDFADAYLPRRATVVETHAMTERDRYFRFQVDDSEPLAYLPGQFFELSLPGIGQAPISLSSSVATHGVETFEMVIRRVGNVTNALHQLSVGDTLGYRGPYGTCFPVDDVLRGRDILFVCGGLGLVPLRSAILHVLVNRDLYGRVTILLGARTPNERLFVQEVHQWKARADVTLFETVDTADPSWGGSVGVITTLIRRAPIDAERAIALVCGPPVMYRFAVPDLERVGLGRDAIYVSLERHMKCGVGKCGHCQIEGVYACQDGPVFRYSDIAEYEEAI